MDGKQFNPITTLEIEEEEDNRKKKEISNLKIESPSQTKDFVFSQFFSETNKLIFSMRPEEALKYLKLSQSNIKENYKVYLNKAFCNLTMGNLNKAMIICNLALSERPKSFSVLMMKGEIFFKMGKPEYSLVFFYRAKKINPSSIYCSDRISTCQQEILESIGDINKQLSKKGDLSFLQKQIKMIDEEKLIEDYEVDKMDEQFKNYNDDFGFKFYPENKKLKRLMGDLHFDRRLFYDIFKREGQITDLSKGLAQTASQSIKFIDKNIRTLFVCTQPIKKKLYIDKNLPPPSLDHNCHEEDHLAQEFIRIDKEQEEGKYEESIARAFCLLEFIQNFNSKQLKPNDEALASVFCYLGNGFLNIFKLDKAEENFKKAKEIASKRMLERSLKLAIYSLGVIDLKRGNLQKAITKWNLRLAFSKDACEMSWLKHDMGRAMYLMENFESAQKFGFSGLFHAIEAKDPIWTINNLILLAQSQVKLEKYEEASSNYTMAASIVQKLGDQSLVKMIEEASKNVKEMTKITNQRKKDLEKESCQSTQTQFGDLTQVLSNKNEQSFLKELTREMIGS